MKTLKINLSYECTAECSHCRFHCVREKAAPPDFETPVTIARQLRDAFGLDMAVVLGGEPSIYAEQTHALLSKLHGLGIATRLETNASWAKSPRAAAEFLEPLQASRTSVMLSLDAFHAAYIPYINIINAIQACRSLGIPFNLEIPYLDMEHKTHPMDVQTQELRQKMQLDFGGSIPIFEGNIVFTGRAASTYGEAFSYGRGIPRETCDTIPWWIDGDIDTADLLIYEPGGYITKGCGIAIGNVFRQDIVRIVEDYDAGQHPIFSVLLREGPVGLAKIAEQFGYQMKADYADKCHLCHEARQVLHPHFLEHLQPGQHYPSQAQAVHPI